MKETVGYHKIPRKLVGADKKIILAWARGILKGQEPKLKGTDIRAIENGKISEIFLEPRIPGTYLPDGTFIQVYDYSPPIGGDLGEAEKEWELQDRIDNWVLEENKRFNKKKSAESQNELVELWEHGKRIVDFCDKTNISPNKLIDKLEQMGRTNDYKSMKHEYCVLFYRWKPDLKKDDPVLLLNWKKLAHTLMFGKSDNLIKDYVLERITNYPLNLLTSSQIALLLQRNLKRLECNEKYSSEEKREILNIRKKMKRKEEINISELENIVNIIKKEDSVGRGGIIIE
jgi:hypothetical protein